MNDILINIDGRGVATITLNRPERHNAFDDGLLRELHAAIGSCRQDEAVRVLVLAAEGNSFCAGADLNWMRRMAGYTKEENYQDALVMADFFVDLATLPKPTIAVVQGGAFGGGVGLAAACDIVIAAESARFALSEVKVGLIPAVISPYLIRAIGERNTRRYALTGEVFGAKEALAMGLVHVVASSNEMSAALEVFLAHLLANSPTAMAAVKSSIPKQREHHLREQRRYTAGCIAEMRGSAEGREGVAAFLEKRKPAWVK